MGFGGARDFLFLTSSPVASDGHPTTKRLAGVVKNPVARQGPKFVFHLCIAGWELLDLGAVG